MTWSASIPVTSTNISSIRYEDTSHTLEVTFNNGSVYQYYDVPERDWEGLQQADSKGTYLNQSIKGRYRYSRV